MNLQAGPLSPETTHPQLSIISPALTNSATRSGNGGTSTKTPDIAPCTNRYDLAASKRPGRPVLSASRNTPRLVKTDASGVSTLEISMLERHAYTSQSFMPMGGSDKVGYIAVVADSDQSGSRPDLTTLRAFTVRGKDGICYGAGLWHAPMAVVGKVGQRVSKLTPDHGLWNLSVCQRRSGGGLRDGRLGCPNNNIMA
ncbi:ureidoglycolate hydrolase-domain-containing protein [Naematelia encephala]|uniref:Ureidoglycolate hydrolase-domain-containing protein n=1 Tax=Naematelia encephala TaxID=71784 RepID=A0A1Y2AW58_9TREE|nr:ureidoglycolate hydrolase-domain-containing protein [Naematelia encephala]